MNIFPSLNKLTLSFKDNKLEEEFIEFYHKRFISQIKFAMLLAVFFYSIFGLLDCYLYPSLGKYFLLIRIFFVCPIFILIALLISLNKFKKYIQLILSIGGVISGIGVLEMIRVLYANNFISNIYFTGLIIIAIYCYTFLRIRFIYAFIVGALNFLGYEVITTYFSHIPTNIIVTNTFFLGTINIIGMIVCYNLELDSRRYFLLLKKLRKEKEILAKKNLTLDKLVHLDDLTRIPNKRYLIENLRFYYDYHRKKKKELSLLMIDVDFFKNYNDYYGHLQGDKCLIKISENLTKHVRKSRDVLARFGGEEFVILLPETSKAHAISIAERIRCSIRDMEIPHKKSEIDKFVTVSIGVASTIPDNKNYLEILNNADYALYKAKKKGRNRVCFIEELS